MWFTIENEKRNRRSFLVVQIIREDKEYATSAYRKQTISGVYTHFRGYLSSTYECGSVYTLP